jgi:lipid-binding SYLF domain-containing protein
MRTKLSAHLVCASWVLWALPALADNYDDTVGLFRNANVSAAFFDSSYGYAVFPTIGKGGLVLGAAYGTGRVYQHGRYVGDTSMTQLSIGFQAGGQAYSEILFFQDHRAFEQFTSGTFSLGAHVSAVAITAGASASAGTEGSTAGASAGQHDATTAGDYQNGVAVFTIAKGGLMYEASIAGQKFSYRSLGAT